MLNSDNAEDILGMAERVAGVLASAKEQKAAIDAQPTDEPTPDESDGDACPICGKTEHHPMWIGIIHLVLVFLYRVFNIVKK